MTDEQAFLALCDRFGLVIEKHEGGKLEQLGTSAVRYTISQGRAPHQTGYCDFYSSWNFDTDGKFVEVGHWE